MGPGPRPARTTHVRTRRVVYRRLSWGTQIDVRRIGAADGLTVTGQLGWSRERAAGYLAKYATKGAGAIGGVDYRIDEDAVESLRLSDHLREMMATCFDLARRLKLPKLGRWAHQLGFGGHFLTKARTWSTTFKVLRAARSQWVAAQQQRQREDDEATHAEVVPIRRARLAYTGSGYRHSVDEAYAEIVRKDHQEQRALVKQELSEQPAA